jgi:hypothetical protein
MDLSTMTGFLSTKKGADSMLQTIEGIYRNGKVELLEAPSASEGVRVIVTFLDAPAELNNPTDESVSSIDLVRRGISSEQALDLRSRLQSFAEDWERPEMDVYDEL